jgi:hypothetical protein
MKALIFSVLATAGAIAMALVAPARAASLDVYAQPSLALVSQAAGDLADVVGLAAHLLVRR